MPETPSRILVSDDDREIRSLLRLYLENEGYAVEEAADGPATLEKLAGGDIDLCLLDIMMPGLDGLHVLQRIRESSSLPVILISAKGTDPDKILGLDMGADDYIAKPFNPLEAMARIRSALRRSRRNAPEGSRRAPAAELRHRDLTLDLDACCLYRNGTRIDLTSVEYRIMAMFMEHPGKVYTKQQIYECGWGDDFVISDNNVMVCISKLRAKLDEDPSAYIKTIRGLGYRLEKEHV